MSQRAWTACWEGDWKVFYDWLFKRLCISASSRGRKPRQRIKPGPDHTPLCSSSWLCGSYGKRPLSWHICLRMISRGELGTLRDGGAPKEMENPGGASLAMTQREDTRLGFSRARRETRGHFIWLQEINGSKLLCRIKPSFIVRAELLCLGFSRFVIALRTPTNTLTHDRAQFLEEVRDQSEWMLDAWQNDLKILCNFNTCCQTSF